MASNSSLAAIVAAHAEPPTVYVIDHDRDLGARVARLLDCHDDRAVPILDLPSCSTYETTAFKKDEVAAALAALPLCESLEVFQVVEEVGWRETRWKQDPKNPRQNEAAAYPVKRGSLVGLGPREALLWMHGAIDGLGRRPHLQSGRGTPKPIRLVRDAGHGSWDDIAMTTLALSKMNWNTDGFYDPLSITMSHTKVLARVLKRVPKLGSAPFQFRFFM